MARAIKVHVKMNEDAIRLADQLPVLVQRKWGRKAVKQAANVMAVEVRKRAPASDLTGTRKLWSAKTKASRAAFKTLRRAVKVYLHKRDVSARVWSPLTNLFERGWQMKFWGRDGGRRYQARPVYRPAMDATRRQQHEAIVKTLRRGIEQEVANYR